jgi:hypothetical protein
MASVDDEIVWPLTGNDDLMVVGLAPDDDDDTREDAALFGINVGGGPAAPIDLDGGGGEGATATRTPVHSNGSAPSVAGNTSGAGTGKRKSAMWADFGEIYETVNGREICTKATCKMCKHTLFARSNAGTGHLKRHQKSCRQKLDQAARHWYIANYGSTLLTARHWYIAEKILEFLEVFYESTVVLSGVYYPTSPLILQHLLDIAAYLHESEKDKNLIAVVYPMKLKFLKY